MKTKSTKPKNKSVSESSYGQCDEALTKRIAEAAYFKAESRGFESGHEMEDWLNAEKEVRQ